MPELPEVETIRIALCSELKGATITHVTVRRHDMRVPVTKGFASTVSGCKIMELRRRAKYILIDLDNNQTIVVHLGMSGRLLCSDNHPNLQKHDHVLIEVADKDGKQRFVIFNDPRRFGLILVTPTESVSDNHLFAQLGVEPLEQNFTADYLASELSTRRIAVKLAIMDQRIVVGIGNIYASESLFHARIAPTRPASSLTIEEIKSLVVSCRKVLRSALKAGGSSLRDYVHTDGAKGGFQNNFAVYGRAGEACPGCTCDSVKTGGIIKITQSGRSTFWCKTMQH